MKRSQKPTLLLAAGAANLTEYQTWCSKQSSRIYFFCHSGGSRNPVVSRSLDSGACLGRDPGFAGVTNSWTSSYEPVKKDLCGQSVAVSPLTLTCLEIAS